MKQTLKICLFALPARRAVPLPFKIGLIASILIAAPFANAGELGRLFFTPEQRQQLDYNYAREARPDNNNTLMLNGIVQRNGGKRTAWINGVPQAVGRSDENMPESVPVRVPGKNKSVKLKVGQRVLLDPSVNPDAAKQALPE